jgi:hypothetical protein
MVAGRCRLADELGELPGIDKPVRAVVFWPVIAAFSEELP